MINSRNYISRLKIQQRKNNRKWLFYRICVISISIFLIIIIPSEIVKYYKSSQNKPEVKGISSLNLTNISLSKIPKIKNQAKLPMVNSRQYALVDAKSGYLVVSKDENKRVPIASMTKIATALVAIENYKLDEIVTISKNASSTIGSDAQFKTGEQVKVIDLLNAILISSANDGAIALAEHSGSIENFVKKMNDKIDALGLTNTRFNDPSGLDDEGFSSAKDISIILTYALRKPEIKSIVNQSQKEIISIDGISHQLDNSNRLVKDEMYLSGIIGGKTGFTPIAGHNLIAAATRNQHTLIAVIINTFDNSITASAEEAKKLLEWGFTNLEY
ncbi:MAG: D-alanyl-D-alanine carboxypeptidase [Candidatus Berkelbacteria bacterium Licking1014_85]|uniref:D-alanyl-D-alanine carboxypeptidase n=1 Tax=Candidatus Berkelbacteria bacterium Licking1014_85 TaxID=2017148 RepID=A0A554LNB3_9BACT|nr:MAG: D-alanyl-D-alanine carboxypeptidase [Candidatus Berkelbacteria bacterium Licking1014_85]